MLKTVLAVTAALLVALPAAARTAAEPAPTTPVETKAERTIKPQRYCIEESHTGSRLRTRTCQTRDEWLAQGFDPLVK